MVQLAGKTIALTGATSGIGRALAEGLSSASRVVAIGRASTRSEALTADCPEIDFITADLSSRDGVETACAAVLTHRSISGLINCAALQETPHFLEADFDIDAMHREIAVNFSAPCHLIARLLPVLVKQTDAFILNVNSGLGLVPKTNSAVYCGTKGGLNILSQALRNQLEHTSVKVLQAFLPLVDTPMTEGRGTGKISAVHAADKIIAGIEREIPENDVGKVRLLRRINRMSPALARRIMRKA